MTTIRRLLVCALLFVVTQQATVAPAPGVPALNITTPSGQDSVLIGSVHIGLPGLRQPHPDVFAKVRNYVVEQIAGEGERPKPRMPWQPAIEHKARTGETKWAPWAETLEEHELAELRRRIVCNGMPFGKDRQVLEALLVAETPLTASEIAIRRCVPMSERSRDQVLVGCRIRQGSRHPRAEPRNFRGSGGASGGCSRSHPPAPSPRRHVGSSAAGSGCRPCPRATSAYNPASCASATARGQRRRIARCSVAAVRTTPD